MASSDSDFALALALQQEEELRAYKQKYPRNNEIFYSKVTMEKIHSNNINYTSEGISSLDEMGDNDFNYAPNSSRPKQNRSKINPSNKQQQISEKTRKKKNKKKGKKTNMPNSPLSKSLDLNKVEQEPPCPPEERDDILPALPAKISVRKHVTNSERSTFPLSPLKFPPSQKKTQKMCL